MSSHSRRNQQYSRSQHSSSVNNAYGQYQGYDDAYGYASPSGTSYGSLPGGYETTPSATPQASSPYATQTQSTPYSYPTSPGPTHTIQYGAQGPTPPMNGTGQSSSYGRESTQRSSYRNNDEYGHNEPRSTRTSRTYDTSGSTYTPGAVDHYRSSTDHVSLNSTHAPTSVDGSQDGGRSPAMERYPTSHQGGSADYNGIGAHLPPEDMSSRRSELSVSSLSSTTSSTMSGPGARYPGSANPGQSRPREDTGHYQQRQQGGGSAGGHARSQSNEYAAGDTVDPSPYDHGLHSDMQDLSIHSGQNMGYAAPREQSYYGTSSSTTTVGGADIRDRRSRSSQTRGAGASSSSRPPNGSSRSTAPPSSSSRRLHRTSTSSASRPRRINSDPIEENQELEYSEDFHYRGSRGEHDYEEDQGRSSNQYPPYSSGYSGSSYTQY